MSKFREILNLLQSTEEETQLLGLSQLCEVLSLSTQDHLHAFDSAEYTHTLTALLKKQTSNANLPLLAARAMTNMLEALPSSAQHMMISDAVTELCSKLLSIQYIDLAEQCLLCLGALCSNDSNAMGVLRAGGLAAILGYIDFFSLTVQRQVLQIAADMVQRIPGSCFDMVLQSVPNVQQIFLGTDDKCIDSALKFFSHVTQAFARGRDSKRLEMMATNELISPLLTILTGAIKDPSHAPKRLGQVLQIFLHFVEYSALVTGTLLDKDIVSILSSYSKKATGQHLNTLLSIGVHILPHTKLTKHPDKSIQTKMEDLRQKRLKYMKENPNVLLEIGLHFMPTFINICNSSVDATIQRKCLDGVLRVLDHSDIRKLFRARDYDICTFILTLVQSGDDVLIVSGIKIVTILMTKASNMFKDVLIREGVVFAIHEIAYKSTQHGDGEEKETQPPLLPLANRAPRIGRSVVGVAGRGRGRLPGPSMPRRMSRGGKLPPIPSTKPPPPPLTSAGKNAMTRVCSEKLIRKFFKGIEPDNLRNITELKKICRDLQDVVRRDLDQSDHLECLRRLHGVLINGNVTTFEFSKSNIIPVLVQYLTFEQPKDKNKSRVGLVELSLMNRHRWFAHVFLGLPLIDCVTNPLELKKPESPPKWSQADTKVFEIILKLLNAALDLKESFPLHFIKVGSQLSSPSSNTRLLSQPFRLKLRYVPSTFSRQERFRFDTRTVLIDSLGTCRSVRNYIINEIVHIKPPSVLLKDPSLQRQTRSMANRSKKRKLSAKSSTSSSQGVSGANSGRVGTLSTSSEDLATAQDHYETTNPLEMASNISASLMIKLLYNGHPIPDQMTMFEAIKRFYKDPTKSGTLSQSQMGRSVQNLLSSTQKQPQYNGIDLANIYNVDHEFVFDVQIKPPANQSMRSNLEDEQASEKQKSKKRSRKVFQEQRSLTQYNKYTPQKNGSQHDTKLRTKGRGKIRYGSHHSTLVDLAVRENGVVVDIAEKRPVTRRREKIEIHESELIEKDPTNSILELMKFLHALNVHWRSLYSGFYSMYLDGVDVPAGTTPLVSPSVFQNKKLTHKMTKQLEDPLSVCSDSIPSWCADLMAHYHFLFPFDQRFFYFRLAAFGRTRAFASLHKHLEKEGLVDLNRVQNGVLSSGERPENRITPIKIRIRRSKVLEQATKHFKAQAKTRNMLRVEFDGEVGAGVGQGPTLEFFTLLSHEIQRRDLLLWRDDVDDEDGEEDDIDEVEDEDTTGDEDEEMKEMPPSSLQKATSKDIDGDVLMDEKKGVVDENNMGNSSKSEIREKSSQNLKRKRSSKPQTHEKNRNKRKRTSHQSGKTTNARSGATTSMADIDDRKDAWIPVLEDSSSSATTHFGGGMSGVLGALGLVYSEFKFPKDFHQVVVAICPNCNVLQVPNCKTHSRLLTMGSDKQWACNEEGCKTSVSNNMTCEFCTHHTELKCWCINNDEASYLETAWPKNVSALPLIVLKCEHCCCVNFPGAHKALCVNRGGKITSLNGLTINERGFKNAIRHLHKKCQKSVPQCVPVILSHEQALLISSMAQTTPYVSEDGLITVPVAGETASSPVEYVRCSSGIFPHPLSSEQIRKSPNVTKKEETYLKTIKEERQSQENNVGASSSSSKSLQSTEEEKACEEQVIEYFEFLGRLIGQALMDNCLLDIPFAQAFFKALLGERMSIYDVLEINYHLGKTLLKLDAVANKWNQALLFHNLTSLKELECGEHFEVDGVSIDKLGLDFSVPGMKDCLLKPNGDKIDVTLANVRQYVDAISRFFLVGGIKRQFDAIRRGFHEICAIRTSKLCFSASELQDLVCGADSDRVPWDFSKETLRECVKTDHGYTLNSEAITYFFEILEEFTPREQRQFVRFVTGCPRLPVGGLKNLRPRVTIVRIAVNSSSNGSQGIDCTALPSAMTCTNYVKLPEYTSKELMRKKLIKAMEESQSGFLLT